MAKQGKKYRAALEKVELHKKYTLEEGLAKVKEIAFAKFDETVELTMWLGVDPRKADQMVRGTVVLPNGLGGKAKVVVVIAQGDKIREAEEAGADFSGGDDIVDKTGVIHSPVGKVSFDDAKLLENTRTLITAVMKAKPTTAKGRYLKKINLAATMSPGVLLDELAYV